MIDKLASKGMKFNNFHAAPVCSVTRSELLTGNNSHEVGMGAFGNAQYPPAMGKKGYESYLTKTTVTVAELLRDAGYHTYTAGKWHIGGAPKGKGWGPSKWGFEKSYGIYGWGSNHWDQRGSFPQFKSLWQLGQVKLGIVPNIKPTPFFENGEPVKRPANVFSDELYTDKNYQYIDEDKKDGKPFFAYVAYTTPHWPIQGPQDLIEANYDYYYKNGYQALEEPDLKR